MSASSGIGVSPELSEEFSKAVQSASQTRYIKISIRNESLVYDLSKPTSGSFVDDLAILQETLDDNTPAYVLARLDAPAGEWLAIFYVPDTAKVREKMLYASTRNSLLKSLGSSTFTDSIFATSKADLTPEAYEAHLKHIAAPHPMSAREKELAEVKEAERVAGGTAYQGSGARQSPFSGLDNKGFKWSDEAEYAMLQLGKSEGPLLVVITIDMASETLALYSSSEVPVEQLSSSLPKSDPSYAFYAYPREGSKPIVFIYSCPSSSPVKYRMMYSTGANIVVVDARKALGDAVTIVKGRIETSDPSELDATLLDNFFQSQDSESGTGTGTPAEEKKAFAKPRGPVRRPRP